MRVSEPVVRAGDEVQLEWRSQVSHARASAGRMVSWTAQSVRWRAPPVCATASIDIVVQYSDGQEERRLVQVVPAPATDGLAILPTSDPRTWEVHWSGPEVAFFAVSEGDVAPIASEAGCQRAHWRLEASGRPDVAVAAVFAHHALIGWVALPRSARRVQKVEAPVGSTVSVEIDGRVFSGGPASEPVVHVPVEVPPGAGEAAIRSGEKSVTYALAAPSPPTRHWVRAPDGALWLFTTDVRGQRADGAPPAGSVRVLPGAFRWSSVPAVGALPALEGSRVTEPSRPGWTWRAGIASSQGPSIRYGIAGYAGLEQGASGPGAGAAVLYSGVRHDAEDANDFVEQRALGFATWGEWGTLLLRGPLRLWAGAGAGAAFVQHRYDASFDRARRVREVGPLGTVALRAGKGPLELELRGIGSTARLRAEDDRLGGWVGLAWRGSM